MLDGAQAGVRSGVRSGGEGGGGLLRERARRYGVRQESGGREIGKKTDIRRLRGKSAVCHSCEPGQGGRTVLSQGMCQSLCSYFLILQTVRESAYVTCLQLPPKAD